MHDATADELDAYAASAKAANAVFVRAHFALADACAARGIDIDELGDTDIAVRARQERGA